MKVLLFLLLEIVFAPLQIIGLLVYAYRVRFVNMPRGISGTAYEPYMVRLALHHVTSRNDEAAERIAPHLPALSPFVLRVLMETMALAARWSGFRGSFFAYPGPRPSTLMTFISHRTDFFDNAVAAAAAADSPIRQFVVLGAGLGHALVRTVARRSGPARVGRAGQRRGVEMLRGRCAANARGQGRGPARGRRRLRPRHLRADRLQPAVLAGVADGTRVRPALANLHPLGRRDDVSRRRGTSTRR